MSYGFLSANSESGDNEKLLCHKEGLKRRPLGQQK
jgi:hypothetical protein